MSTPAAVRVAYRDWLIYRQVWRSNVVGAFVQPLLYLLGVGLGIGTLVDDNAGSAAILEGTSYFAFYATALIGTTTMFNTTQEALWSTMDGFAWGNAYRAMVATPLDPRDIAAGFVLRFGARAAIASSGVAIVLALFDDTRSFGLIPAALVGVLCGLAFAMPIAAWTASRTLADSFQAILRFAIIPMFLFGGAFYPIEQLPDVLQVIAWGTPLFHAIELSRGAVLGGLSTSMALLHLVVLITYIGVGWFACVKTIRRRLWP
ncbi:MAG: ABC transporter permease [Acidimicrobiaceae bacterium]|nr:ABC transporter permease [Acidimicrobiaceae bacterium]